MLPPALSANADTSAVAVAGEMDVQDGMGPTPRAVLSAVGEG